MKGTTTSASDRMMMMMMTVRSDKQSNCERIYMLMLLLLLCLAIGSCVGGKTTTIVRHTDTVEPQLDGFWANKTTWNARWVKYWRAKKIYEPVWKKVWTPTIHTEWVPLPNAPEPDAWQNNKQDHHQQHSLDED